MNQNLTGRWVFFRTLRIIIFKKRSYLAKTHQPKQVKTEDCIYDDRNQIALTTYKNIV